MYVSNTRNDDFDYLTFDGDQRFITGRQIYHVNYYILERLNNG